MLNGLKKLYRKAFVTDHPAMLLFGNLRAPQRLNSRLRYDQALGKIPLISRTIPAKRPSSAVDEATIGKCIGDLCKEGIAILPGYFDQEAMQIWDAYAEAKEKWPSGDYYYRTFFGPLGNPLFARVALDETILSIAARYFGCQPYLRCGPNISILHPENDTDPTVINHPYGLETWPWHIDTPNLLSIHLILNDTTAEDTRMLFANRSHRVPRSASGIRTENNITERYKVTDCVGPRGTLYMFDNGGLHRPNAVAGSLRATFEFYFTPGNNIQNMARMRTFIDADAESGKRDKQFYGDGAFDEIDIPADFSPLQRETLERVK
jgi:hypothetical protein